MGCYAHIPDTSGIVAIADAIPDMGALTSLNVSSNNLARGLKANGWAGKSYEADWGEEDDHWGTDMTGIIALANAIPDMRALVCADGRYYHESSLNANVATVKSAATQAHNVRTAPSTKADRVGHLTGWDVVEVVGEQGDWLQIKHRHGEHNTAWTLMQAAGTIYLLRAHKFASTAPDIPDQDEAPLVPLAIAIMESANDVVKPRSNTAPRGLYCR
jgi:hypothetical protein